MSDDFFSIIPVSPFYVPPQAAIDQALALVQSHIKSADHIEVHIHEYPDFINPIQNLETISCPVCKQVLSFEWWGDAMDASFTTNYSELNAVTPCCNSAVSLNDLVYDWPAGFARFVI